MIPTKHIWLDGKLVPWDEAKVHVLAHSLHYGSAVFEGIRFYKTSKGPAIFLLDKHVKRLVFSAKTVGMKLPYTEKQLSDAIIQTVKENDIPAGYIRPLCFYGYGNLGVSPKDVPVQVAIAVWPWGAYLGDEPTKVKISSFIRLHPKSTVQDAKISGHYFNSLLAGNEARGEGYDEALLLDYEGNVAEGSGENLFLVKDGVIFTPSLGTILPGITREAVMTLAKNLGLKVEEKKITRDQLSTMDEAFFTGTAAEVASIASFDGKELPHFPGPVTTKLRDAFMDITHGRNHEYDDWLTYL